MKAIISVYDIFWCHDVRQSDIRLNAILLIISNQWNSVNEIWLNNIWLSDILLNDICLINILFMTVA